MKDRQMLDKVDCKIIQLLQEDARLSFTELGKRVSLSGPAVTERVNKLIDGGIIRGFHADIDLEKMGLPITAFTELSVPKDSNEVAEKIQAFPEIIECHRVTGKCSFILKVNVSSVEHLETFIDRIGKFGNSSTSIVLSTRIKRVVTEGTNT